MNGPTRAISAALFLVEQGGAPRRLLVADMNHPLPALDAVLSEMTGDDLRKLAAAADVLAVRADVARKDRVNKATSAEVAALKAKKGPRK